MCLKENNLTNLIIAMEPTSFYIWHIANILDNYDALVLFKPKVYCLNPRVIKCYKNSFIDIDKTDLKDAFVIADFARVGKIVTKLWHNLQYIEL